MRFMKPDDNKLPINVFPFPSNKEVARVWSEKIEKRDEENNKEIGQSEIQPEKLEKEDEHLVDLDIDNLSESNENSEETNENSLEAFNTETEETSHPEPPESVVYQPYQSKSEELPGEWKSRFVCICSLAVLMITAGFFLHRGCESFVADLPFRTEGVSSTSVSLTSIENVNEMIAIKACFDSMTDREESRKLWRFAVPGTWRKFTVMFSGEVICGIDISKIKIAKIEKIDTDGIYGIDGIKKRIDLILPRCQIMSVHSKLGTLENESGTGNKKEQRIVYDMHGGNLSSPLTTEDQDQAIQDALIYVREKAINEWKLTARAEENARIILQDFLKDLDYDEVNITFADDLDDLKDDDVPNKADESLANSEIAIDIDIEINNNSNDFTLFINNNEDEVEILSSDSYDKEAYVLESLDLHLKEDVD